ncbi:unannotated protein [freshwater metagenome]|uniref:Unannotated protein n=1 Tax=freshwater metagenome TaxID=449393 RepID=A0A6J6EQN6_9ZZZZ
MGPHVRVIADAGTRSARALENLPDSTGSRLEHAGNRARVDVEVGGLWNHGGLDIPHEVKLVPSRAVF